MQAARTTAPTVSRSCVSADGVAQNGDLAVIGSSIKAQNVTLDAASDLTLLSAHNRSDTTGSNSSSGAAIGVSVGVGSGQAGISVFANANRASGKENGDTDSYTRRPPKWAGWCGCWASGAAKRVRQAQLPAKVGRRRP